jgi:hypothetical protein
MRALLFMMWLMMTATATQAASLKACEFASVTEKSTRDAIYAKYGKPDRVIGDPLSIDVYDVTDGGEIWVGWIDKGAKQRFLYIQHVGGDLDHPHSCH